MSNYGEIGFAYPRPSATVRGTLKVETYAPVGLHEDRATMENEYYKQVLTLIDRAEYPALSDLYPTAAVETLRPNLDARHARTGATTITTDNPLNLVEITGAATFQYSDDGGDTWTDSTGITLAPNFDEFKFGASVDGHYILIFSCGGVGGDGFLTSTDGGATWNNATIIGDPIVTNNLSVTGIAISSGVLYFIDTGDLYETQGVIFDAGTNRLNAVISDLAATATFISSDNDVLTIDSNNWYKDRPTSPYVMIDGTAGKFVRVK